MRNCLLSLNKNLPCFADIKYFKLWLYWKKILIFLGFLLWELMWAIETIIPLWFSSQVLLQISRLLGKVLAFKSTQISFMYLHLQRQLYLIVKYRYYTPGIHIIWMVLSIWYLPFFVTAQNSRLKACWQD